MDMPQPWQIHFSHILIIYFRVNKWNNLNFFSSLSKLQPSLFLWIKHLVFRFLDSPFNNILLLNYIRDLKYTMFVMHTLRTPKITNKYTQSSLQSCIGRWFQTTISYFVRARKEERESDFNAESVCLWSFVQLNEL